MTIIHTPGHASNEDAERASERGVYLDENGKRRIVAAGDPIPDGWELESPAAIEDAAAATVTAQDSPNAQGAPRARRGRRSAAGDEGDAGGDAE